MKDLIVEFKPGGTKSARMPTDIPVEINRIGYTARAADPAAKSISRSAVLSAAKRSRKSDWDRAYDAFDHFSAKGYAVDYVEPDISHDMYSQNDKEIKAYKTKKGKYLENWPQPRRVDDLFAWHLGDKFTQLAKARDFLMQSDLDLKVRIAHIDTGYHPTHPTRPENLQWQLGKSFIKGEKHNPAVDERNNSFQEQQGHGCATLAILAGNYVTKDQSDGEFEGYFGAVPFAEIVPIRISDTVALIRSQNFVQAMEYAIATRCDVVSMSMAGMPSKAWARVINKAYEKGITIVTAAGNSWVRGGMKLLPTKLLYPARFDRVIAATGIACNHQPYFFAANDWPQPKAEGGEFMQGNHGPPSKMGSAIAAYTPNTSWGTLNQKHPFIFTGGGTSSATPQVAAAAALWIVKNRKLLKQRRMSGWEKAEAVRYGLFESAKKIKKYQKYLGNGIIQAYDAFDKFPRKSELKESKKAQVFLTGLSELLGIFLKKKGTQTQLPKAKGEMLMTELNQLIHATPELHHLLEIDLEDPLDTRSHMKRKELDLLRETIKNSKSASKTLKNIL